MPAVTFSGLASGLDTGSIIESLVSASREPARILSEKKSDYNNKISLLSDLSTKLSSLRNAARDLDTVAEVRAFRATSSDESAIIATASTSAATGTYALTVGNLAEAERSYSQALAARDQIGLVGSGDLTIQIGSESAVITIDESVDTLEGVAGKINSSGLALQANIVSDGTNTHLLVSGRDSGAENAISFSETGTLATKLGLSSAGAQAQAATDASVTMDGITFKSATNQLTEVIPGVTLDLKTESTQTISIGVDVDPEAVQTNVQAFVDAYNGIAEFLSRQFSFDSETPVTNTLLGDSAARTAQRQLQRVIGAQVSGASGSYTSLSQIGITTEREGTLKLDASKLSAALADDINGVSDLFALNDKDNPTGGQGIARTLVSTIDALVAEPDGVLSARKAGLQSSVRSIDDRVSRLDRQLASYEESLRRQFSIMENTLSNIQSQGNFLSQQLSAGAG